VIKLNIPQAINLRKQIQKPNSIEVKLLCTPKDGCTLFLKAKSAVCEDCDNLERIAEENNLSWRFEQGYWVLFN
jgi:hypothetical protein